MSGLSRFVMKNDPTEPSALPPPAPAPVTQPNLAGRQAAKSMKLHSKSVFTKSNSVQQPSHNMPQPYPFKPAASRDSFPAYNNGDVEARPHLTSGRFESASGEAAHHYDMHQEQPYSQIDGKYQPPSQSNVQSMGSQKLLLDESVGDEFDKTMDSIPIGDQRGQENGGGQDEDIPKYGNGTQGLAHIHPERRGNIQQHTLLRKQSKSPMFEKNAPQQNTHSHSQPVAISGRFENVPAKQMNLQIRTGPNNTAEQIERPSRKRPHPEEAPRLPFELGQLSEVGEVDENFQEANKHHVLQQVHPSSTAGSEEDDLSGPSSPHTPKARQIEPPNSQVAQMEPTEEYKPDYNDDQLKSMKYIDLEKEDWEKFPTGFNIRKQLRGKPLEEQLMYYVHDAFIDGENKSQAKAHEERSQFFANLTTKEWEDTGDWFIDSFTEVMQKIKTKRQEKRACAEKYEAQIKAREEAVRGKSDALDKQLRGMRASGESLLRGKGV